MTLSSDSHRGDASPRNVYLSPGSPARTAAIKPKRVNDPQARQTEGQVADLKRRILILKRLISDCDRMAADLDQEVRTEEDRVKIYDPAHSAYSIYARATASRRDNLRRSEKELRNHLAKAERALLDLGEAVVEA
jgi:flagellar protein FliJ